MQTHFGGEVENQHGDKTENAYNGMDGWISTRLIPIRGIKCFNKYGLQRITHNPEHRVLFLRTKGLFQV